MLCMGQTVDEEDVLMIFDQHNTHICKSRSREDDFSSKFHCQRPADHELPACISCHGQLRMRTMTLQTNSYLSSFSLSDPRLSTYW